MADAIAVFGPLDRVTDATGAIVSGGTVEFYDAGTLTPKTVYADADLVTALGTSVSTDSSGYPVTGTSVKTLVYTGTASYKIIVKDSGGNTLLTHDDIRGATAAPTEETTALPITPVSAKASNYTVLTTDQGKLFNVNSTGGAVTMTLPSAVTAGDSFRVGFRHVGTANTVALVTVSSQTISHSGKASTAMALTSYGEGVWLVSDGTNWHVDSYTPKLITGVLPYIHITDRATAPPGSPTPGARYIINGTASGDWATLSFAEHDVAEADGNGSWIKYTPTDGWMAFVGDENVRTEYRDSAWIDQVDTLIPGAFANLVVTGTGNTAATVTADYVTVRHSNGSAKVLSSVSLTLDASATGANKLDTGALANNTWYYLWVIYAPSTGTTACLLSTSSTSPTMPSGYTYKARVGALITDGSANLMRTVQKGRTAQYIVGSNPATPRKMLTGVSGNVVTPTWTAITAATYVPPTAAAIFVCLAGIATNAYIIFAPNNSYGGVTSTTNLPPIQVGIISGGPTNVVSGMFPLEGSNVYGASNGGNNYIACTGWEDNL